MENQPAQLEDARLDALRRYEILDTPAEEEYDAITRLAAHICRAPVALISFVDDERQWFKSQIGLPVVETTRDVSFCLHAVAQPGILIVPDATQDKRFAANPLVTGAPHIRFYAGAPLVTDEGFALGTLCIIDREARQLTPQEQAALETLAAQVVRSLELRRRTRELSATNAALQAEIERRERAEAERAASFDEMELTIRERTADLRTANDFLQEQIEERKRLFQSVETAKRIWEGTFDSIEQGVIVCDARARVVRCNRRATEMIDQTPAALIGNARVDVLTRLFGAHAAAHIIAHSTHAPAIFEATGDDGSRYLMSVAALPAFDESDDKTKEAAFVERSNNSLHAAESATSATAWQVLTWSDITILAGVQEQLQRARRLATVGAIAAGVAHEINNPLAAITTCAEAVRRDLRDALASEEHAIPTIDLSLVHDTRNSHAETSLSHAAEGGDWAFYLEEIVRQTLRCKAITGGLLDLARERQARFAPVDVNAVIENCARLFRESAPENVRFTLDPEPRLAPLSTDETLLRQILDNLVSNALHAVAENNDARTREIILRTGTEGNSRVMIEVGDTGAGIAPENLARIFDPFWTTKHTGHGAGLGLAVCQTLAETLGASLAVESKLGAGSRFRLWLPKK